MVICKFFLQGNCKFGDNCRNEHPGARSGGFGNQGNNRYGALSGNRFGGGGGGSNARKDVWQYNPDELPNDLAAGKGRPQWILSSYGPGKNAPASLLEANEFSPEEVRARFYELASQGKEDEADQEAISLWTKAEQDIGQVLNNSRYIEKFMRDTEKKHPNRDDFTKWDGSKTRDQFVQDLEPQSSNMGGFGSGSGGGGGFGAGSSSGGFGKPAASTFGQPSQPSTTFGKPAFGQDGFGGGSPSGGGFGQASSGGGFGTLAFGQSGFGGSSFGQPAQPTSGFGQPSQPSSTFGQPSQPSSAFGQPSQPTSAFGQPSQPSGGFGQPAFGSSSFGSSAQKNPFAPATASGGFGQPAAAFGQPSQPSSAFGQPSQPTSAFGQPNQPSPFGQASQPTSTFGQPTQPASTFGQPSQPSSTFGQPSQPSSGFGQTPQTSQPGNSFGTPAPAFGQNAQLSGGFGQSTPSNASPFGQPAAVSSAGGFGQPSTTSSGFGAPPATTSPFGTRAAEDQPREVNMETTTPTGSRPASRANPFGAPPTQPLSTAATGSSAKPIINTSTTPHPLTNRPPHALTYTQSLPLTPAQKDRTSGRLNFYRGQRVEYVNNAPCYRRPDTRELEKIWFPDAGATPDVVALNKEDKIQDCEGDRGAYTEDVLGSYRYLLEQGRWRDGMLPLVPPLREWGVYDF